jgi:hypothetical protein
MQRELRYVTVCDLIRTAGFTAVCLVVARQCKIWKNNFVLCCCRWADGATSFFSRRTTILWHLDLVPGTVLHSTSSTNKFKFIVQYIVILLLYYSTVGE